MYRIEVSLIKAMFGWKFSARIAGTMFQATGKTKAEAVGELVVKYGHEIGLTVIAN